MVFVGVPLLRNREIFCGWDDEGLDGVSDALRRFEVSEEVPATDSGVGASGTLSLMSDKLLSGEELC